MQNEQWKELKEWLVNLKAIDEEISSPEEITRLDLSNRSLEELPESFGVLNKLLALNLATNRLDVLPESFAKLTNLSNLDIRRNSFKVLPKLLSQLPIRSINASGNQLEDISILQSCLRLRVLDLSANGMGNLSQFLPIKNDLRTLNLSCNLIKDISGFVENLQSVERLNLSSNIIEEIPKNISELESIEEIDFSDNAIKTIADAFFDLEVESVDLSSNSLTHLHLHSLESLEKFVLDDNRFEVLEIEDYFAPYLREFSCDSCNLKEFLLPPTESLELLCYSSNKIKTIPTEVGQYNKLLQLDIDENEIEELPDSLANLVYLQTFYAKGNPLNENSKKVVAVLSPNICDLNMKSGISIEFAKTEDLDAMANLLSVLFAIEKDFTFNYEKQIAGITKLFEYEGSDMLVAKYESEVVGMVTMQRLISSAEGDYVGQIEDLVVKDEYRKMGVGSRLINKMRSVALEYGYKRIQLAADVDNENALQFYNKRGFHKTNLNVYHYGV
jgi:Leucine-rich repeat (LRR) protein